MKAALYEMLASRTEAVMESGQLLSRIHMTEFAGIKVLEVNQSADLLHAILGVTGEVSEMMRIDDEAKDGEAVAERQLKELGDIWWYARMIPRIMEQSLESFVETVKYKFCINQFVDLPLHLPTDALTEPLKKWYFYGLPIDSGKLLDSTATVVALAMSELTGANEDTFDSVLEQVWTMNIEKLRKRYPEKFDQALAQTHDGQ